MGSVRVVEGTIGSVVSGREVAMEGAVSLDAAGGVAKVASSGCAIVIALVIGSVGCINTFIVFFSGDSVSSESVAVVSSVAEGVVDVGENSSTKRVIISNELDELQVVRS